MAKHIVFLFVSLILTFQMSYADQVVGANQTIALNASTRSAGAGDVLEAVPGSALGLALHPMGMLDLYDWRFGISHTEHFEGSQLDATAIAFPLDENTVLGAYASRFGSSDIPLIREGDPLPLDGEWNTFSVADYQLTIAIARNLPYKLQVASALHLLYRDYDQNGFGMRFDAQLQYNPVSIWSIGMDFQALSSSMATWESGYFEYSKPELYTYTKLSYPMPYLYGTVHIGYKSAGLMRGGNRSFKAQDSFVSDSSLTKRDSLAGYAYWEDPISWLRDGAVGAEVAMDWGGSLRAGFMSLNELQSWTIGAGVELYKWLLVDYAFQRHPRLSGVHKIGLEIKPWWRSAKEPVKAKVEPIKVKEVETPKAPILIEEEEGLGQSWEE